MTLDSGGTIALNSLNGSAVLQGGPLTNVDNTISGDGLLANGFSLINQAAGVVDATFGTFTVGTGAAVVSNQGLIEATDTGALLVTGSTINNADGVIKSDGSNAVIYLRSATIEGGTITATNGGTIRALDSGVTLDGSTAGAITVGAGTTLMVTDHDTTNEQWNLKGTIHNFGKFLVQPDQYFAHVNAITIDAAGVTLDSGGTIALNALNGSAALQGGPLTNVDNTISGDGLLANGFSLINQAAGVVDATFGTFTIATGAAVISNAGDRSNRYRRPARHRLDNQ